MNEERIEDIRNRIISKSGLEDVLNSFDSCNDKFYSVSDKLGFLFMVEGMINSLDHHKIDYNPVKIASTILGKILDKEVTYKNSKWEINETISFFNNGTHFLKSNPGIYEIIGTIFENYENHSNLTYLLRSFKSLYLDYTNGCLHDYDKSESFLEIITSKEVKDLLFYGQDDFMIDHTNYVINEIFICDKLINPKDIINQMYCLFNKAKSDKAKKNFINFSHFYVFKKGFDNSSGAGFRNTFQGVKEYKKLLDLLEPLSLTFNYNLFLEDLSCRHEEDYFYDLNLGKEGYERLVDKVESYLDFLKDNSFIGFIDRNSLEFYNKKIAPNVKSKEIADHLPIETVKNLINVYGLAAYAIKDKHDDYPMSFHYDGMKEIYFNSINEIIDSSENLKRISQNINSWCLDTIRMIKNGTFREMYLKEFSLKQLPLSVK
ncbi:hypothetical protein HN385_03350 [archaeon]|nr:hypothetical protein [archaeon]MBT3451482.1 hypothetical protein [archaeon]MBT6869732.1 hypothetical protein [archaeon]MBT7380712.1 hypothetical protein [archaeon]MBT7508352.1 hypothetical protein [archaeon]